MGCSLKKSFEYKNYLKELFNNAVSLLQNESFMTKTKVYHYINRVNKEEEDKVEENDSVIRSTHSYISPNGLISFTVFIRDTITRLDDAIVNAKTKTYIKDYDALVSQNIINRELLSALCYANTFKSKEKQSSAYGRKFNNDGEQVEYVYDTKEVTAIDFNRNYTKSLAASIRAKCNAVSEKIDEIAVMPNTVDFETMFEIGESFEEAYERYSNLNDVDSFEF